MAEPWAQYLTPEEEQAFVRLMSKMPPAVDPRPPHAFDPDGKPRVPFSGPPGSDPYPPMGPTGRTSQDTNWIDDPWASAGLVGGQVSSLLAGLAGANPVAGSIGSAARGVGRVLQNPEMLSSAARSRAAGQVGKLHAAEAQAAAHAAGQAQRGFSQFQQGMKQPPPGTMITSDPQAVFDARASGMIRQRNNTQPVLPGVVNPNADPATIARMEREAMAAAQRQFRDASQATREMSGAPAQLAREAADLQVNDVASRLLTVARERMGDVSPDQLAKLPRGAYERLLANEGLGPYLAASGKSMDDVIDAMGRLGYAIPPRAPFNANVMQQFQQGRVGAVPMTPHEKAMRDALHARNRPYSGDRINPGGDF